MIDSEAFVAALDEHGHDYFTGVPCSHLGGPIALLTDSGRYRAAPNEGTAAALAAGAYLAGRRPVVLLQNSGFGNLVNPLTSLLVPYAIPVLFVMSMRGWPDAADDEVQHAVMGRASIPMLDAFSVAHAVLPEDVGDLDGTLAPLEEELDDRRNAFLLVPRKSLSAGPPAALATRGVGRASLLHEVVATFDGARFVSTTGYTSRALFAVRDEASNFYMQGSMGHALAIGVALAESAPSERVVVLDGDGALLMHLGSVAVVAETRPPNLVHVVLDNGSYESTGGQVTPRGVDLVVVGRGAGYATASRCGDVGSVREALAECAASPGPHLVVVDTYADEGGPTPRATAAVSAPEITTRFAARAREH